MKIDYVNIYCLINPGTRKPFYVGTTKNALNIRLSGHIHELTECLPKYWNDKNNYISFLMSTGNKPKIKLLYTCTLAEVDHYEPFFYNLLIKQGYSLFQYEYTFCYAKKMNNKRYIKYITGKNRKIKQYSKIYFKNILIIIW